MATPQVTKPERQKSKLPPPARRAEYPETDFTSRRVAEKSIPSTFARAAFPLGGIGTGTVSLGARGELRDWELRNSPAKGCRPANSCFAIHARPEGGVAVNRVLEARLGGDPAWGVATIAGYDVTLDVRGGTLDRVSVSLRGRALPSVH